MFFVVFSRSLSLYCISSLIFFVRLGPSLSVQTNENINRLDVGMMCAHIHSCIIIVHTYRRDQHWWWRNILRRQFLFVAIFFRFYYCFTRYLLRHINVFGPQRTLHPKQFFELLARHREQPARHVFIDDERGVNRTNFNSEVMVRKVFIWCSISWRFFCAFSSHPSPRLGKKSGYVAADYIIHSCRKIARLKFEIFAITLSEYG